MTCNFVPYNSTKVNQLKKLTPQFPNKRIVKKHMINGLVAERQREQMLGRKRRWRGKDWMTSNVQALLQTIF